MFIIISCLLIGKIRNLGVTQGNLHSLEQISFTYLNHNSFYINMYSTNPFAYKIDMYILISNCVLVTELPPNGVTINH